MSERLKVLVVDDVEMNRIILNELFCDIYTVLQAENGKVALDIIRENPDLSAVLLDVAMPVMDGIATLGEIKKEGLIPAVPIFFVTADSCDDVLIKGFEMGIVDRIIKPYNPYAIRQRVKNSIELYDYRVNLEKKVMEQTEEIEQKSKKIESASSSLIEALSNVIEFRDCESGEHVRRIRQTTKIILEQFEKLNGNKWFEHDEIEKIAYASVMHDIGKIAVPDYILNKPGRLTDEEFAIMKEHSINGCKILESIDFIKDSPMYKYYYDICRSHHERWNGKGYPDGLKGDEIPFSAQVVSLADVYDALTSVRVYKAAYSHEEAVRMILDGECGEFNPEIIECFKIVNNDVRKALDEINNSSRNKPEIPRYERKALQG